MVPDAFREHFTATATGAGALIGLLFVSISLRPDTVFGTKAAVHGRALAGSAFTALVNAFFVSLLALMPQSNLGYSAAIMAQRPCAMAEHSAITADARAIGLVK